MEKLKIHILYICMLLFISNQFIQTIHFPNKYKITRQYSSLRVSSGQCGQNLYHVIIKITGSFGRYHGVVYFCILFYFSNKTNLDA